MFFQRSCILPRFCAALNKIRSSPNRTFGYQSGISYAKKTVPFTYVREKKPQSIFTSGDNETWQSPDLAKPTSEFESCKGLANAEDIVKKLVSLEFASNKNSVIYQRRELMNLVHRHCLDTGSAESKVAALTVSIRHKQVLMKDFPQNKVLKVSLKEAIDRRKKLLKNLRRSDYQRFEWLLDKLNITYQSPPLFYHWTTRKGTLRNLTQDYCIKLRKAKIDAYRNKLKAQQPEFLDEKEQTLKWIKQEEETLQLTTEEKQDMEKRQIPFKIPVFPKYLSFKKPLTGKIKYFPPEL